MLSNEQTIRSSKKKKSASPKNDPKIKFQSKLNAILTDVVSNLESLAKEVLPKEEVDKLNKKNEQKIQK